MSLLYLAGESDADEDFCASCAGKLTGIVFNRIPLRNRKGDGVQAVKKQMKNAVKMARAMAGGPEPVAFIAIMDNDRAPHPENSALPSAGTGLDRGLLLEEERDLPERAGWMLDVVEEVLKADRSKWPIAVALAIPVEMIESWIVRSLREQVPQPMPHFSTSGSRGVLEYYHQTVGAAPPQWKDLADEEQSKRGFSDKREFHRHVVKNLDAEALASRSLSFRMFKEWLDRWPRAGVAT